MADLAEQLYEQALVIRSRIGDERAFAELLALYGPRLLLFTQRMMHSSPESIEDITQEIWVAIFRALPGLIDATKFRSWAYRIARDRIYREYRRRKIPTQPLDEARREEMPDGDADRMPVDSEELRRCLAVIAPEHREALVLRFFDDLSCDEIARVTGATIGTVRSRIHYGKSALKSIWKEHRL